MKKVLMMFCAAASLAVGAADAPKAPAKADVTKQPVKAEAPQCAPEDQPGSPDQKQDQDQQRRRYEIMVLLQAYRITPEDQGALRDQIKSAIVGRLKADFEANKVQRQAQIERIEKRLTELKALDGQSSDAQINQEFERLVNAPINGIGPRGWIGGEKQGKGGPEGEPREQGPGKDGKGNFGDGNHMGQQSGQQQRPGRPMLNRPLNQQQPQGEQAPPPPPAPAPEAAPEVAQ